MEERWTVKEGWVIASNLTRKASSLKEGKSEKQMNNILWYSWWVLWNWCICAVRGTRGWNGTKRGVKKQKVAQWKVQSWTVWRMLMLHLQLFCLRDVDSCSRFLASQWYLFNSLALFSTHQAQEREGITLLESKSYVRGSSEEVDKLTPVSHSICDISLAAEEERKRRQAVEGRATCKLVFASSPNRYLC